MAVLYTPHFVQFLDDDGEPLSGGKLHTYVAGTPDTPKATYTNAGGGTPLDNPVELDASGRAVIFLSGSYKFRLEDSIGNLIRETDNVTAFSVQSATTDDITNNFTEDVVVAADSFIFADASDAGASKRDTVQGILDLVPKLTTRVYYRLSGSPHTFNVPTGVTRVRVTLSGGSGSGAAEIAGNNGADSTCTDGTTLITAARGLGGVGSFSADVSAPAHGAGTNGDLNITGGGAPGGLGAANNSGAEYDHGGNGSDAALVIKDYTGLIGGSSTLTIVIGAGGAAVTGGGTSGAGTDGWAILEY